MIGQADVTIDAKTRLPIPAKFRDETPNPNGTLQNQGSDAPNPPAEHTPPRTVWVSMPRADRTIWLFPQANFSALAKMLDQSLSPEDDIAELNRILFGFAEEITEDSAHRLTLPKKHLELAEMPRDVTLVGALNHLEIHDRADWQAKEAERLAKLPALSAKLAAINKARTQL